MSTPGAAAPSAASIQPVKGKLGIMTVGMGAVCTTLIAGVEAVRKGIAKPIGSLTQMGTIRLGKRTEGKTPLIREFVPLAKLDDIVFAGWDIFGGNLYDAAKTAAGAGQGAAGEDPAISRNRLSQCGGVRPELREAADRDAHQERQKQARPGRADSQGHSGVQEEDRPAGGDLDGSTRYS